jgi:hypothetical protein
VVEDAVEGGGGGGSCIEVSLDSGPHTSMG